MNIYYINFTVKKFVVLIKIQNFHNFCEHITYTKKKFDL